MQQPVYVVHALKWFCLELWFVHCQVTEEQLASCFQKCGQVVDCRICGDPNSAMRFAFIEFLDEAAVHNVRPRLEVCRACFIYAALCLTMYRQCKTVTTHQHNTLFSLAISCFVMTHDLLAYWTPILLLQTQLLACKLCIATALIKYKQLCRGNSV